MCLRVEGSIRRVGPWMAVLLGRSDFDFNQEEERWCVIESERFKFWTNFWCFGRVSYTPKAPKSHAPRIRADRTQTVGIGLELDQNGCLPFDSLVSDSTDRSINPLIDID